MSFVVQGSNAMYKGGNVISIASNQSLFFSMWFKLLPASSSSGEIGTFAVGDQTDDGRTGQRTAQQYRLNNPVTNSECGGQETVQ